MRCLWASGSGMLCFAGSLGLANIKHRRQRPSCKLSLQWRKLEVVRMHLYRVTQCGQAACRLAAVSLDRGHARIDTDNAIVHKNQT